MAFENQPRIDSEAIFIIGPFCGARMIFDCSSLGLPAPTRPGLWKNVENIIRDDTGKEISREPFKMFEYQGKGQGYPLVSYMPKCPKHKNRLLSLIHI